MIGRELQMHWLEKRENLGFHLCGLPIIIWNLDVLSKHWYNTFGPNILMERTQCHITYVGSLNRMIWWNKYWIVGFSHVNGIHRIETNHFHWYSMRIIGFWQEGLIYLWWDSLYWYESFSLGFDMSRRIRESRYES